MTKEFDARNENKSRSVCAAMAEAVDTGKRRLTERERAILDMWPRFEDTGDSVMAGDAYIDGCGDCNIIVAVRIGGVCADLVGEDGFLTGFKPGERVKRPAPEVLDADGVEIKVGDTVRSSMYGDNDFTVSRFVKNCKGETFVMVEEMWSGLPPLTVTHARPDSWERLEEDARKGVCEYAGAEPGEFGTHDCDTCRFYDERGKLICEQLMACDIVRRAKKLAGVER